MAKKTNLKPIRKYTDGNRVIAIVQAKQWYSDYAPLEPHPAHFMTYAVVEWTEYGKDKEGKTTHGLIREKKEATKMFERLVKKAKKAKKNLNKFTNASKK